jgi:hypothetical protein
MRKVILLVLVMAIAGTAAAQDGSNSPGELPIKNKPEVTYIPPADVKVGGDTIETATVIPGIPYTDTGNTSNFNDDYDEQCNSPSTSPDVVYSFTPTSDVVITVDLCGSMYDTKTYIYDSDQVLLYCDDDYYGDGDPCGSWTSKIEGAHLAGGSTYYLVVDGWGGEFGFYNLSVYEFDCVVTCFPDAVAEGEPPIENGYEDNYNTGCNDDPPILQTIDWANTEEGEAWLCGNSGWYFPSEGLYYRDTDWFSVTAIGTEMEITLQSEYTSFVVKMIEAGVCPAQGEILAISTCGELATLTFATTPGEEYWFVVAPGFFQGVVTEFQYFLTLTGHDWNPPVPTEETNWGAVKALYR